MIPDGTQQLNTSYGSATAWIPGSIDTSAIFGQTRSIEFTGNTFNAVSNFATITVRNVAIDGRVVAAQVPEPATLALLALGLIGLGLARRARSAWDRATPPPERRHRPKAVFRCPAGPP